MLQELIAIGLIILILAGCGKMTQMDAHWTGYSIICVNGVSYIQFTSGASVQYDQAGKIVSCTK